MDVKFLQFNVDRTSGAHDLMEATAQERDIDVLIIAEPYMQRTANNDDWIKDEHGLAAIRVRNPHLVITGVTRGIGFVAVTIREIGTVLSCYVSPNSTNDEYESYIQRLDVCVGRIPGPKLIAGDFNGKSLLWNSQKEDTRGRIAAEFVESRNLVVINTGDVPTFSRSGSESILDITLMTPDLAERTFDWKVHTEESLSGHRHITYRTKVGAKQGSTADGNKRPTFRGWNARKADPEAFNLEWSKLTTGNTINSPDELTEVLSKCCDASMPRRRAPGKRGPVYWWNAEIAQQRAICTAARRRVQRAKDLVARESAREQHRVEKRKLKRLIITSKDECWKRVCVEIEQDVWGLGYKIVMRKLKKDISPLDIEEKKEEYRKLFPAHQEILWTVPDVNDLVPYTLEELKAAVKRMKSGKAPGPDKIPAEAVKLTALTDPSTLLRVMNGVLESGEFPLRWKTSQLVLVPKGKKPTTGERRAHRPICLLDVLGKLQERMIATRLEEAIEESGGLSPSQFGFRKGKSTSDAMKEVLNVALEEKAKVPSKRQFCALVTLDIKNAFNSVSWLRIVRELRRRKVPWYLIRIIQSYLEKRRTELEKGVEEKTTGGVPQGSVLGPLLWNIFYDGVLNIVLPDGVKLVAFADDLAVVVTAATEAELEGKTNETLKRIKNWMDDSEIELAPQKTEAVLLIGQKMCREVTFTIGEHLVRPAPKLKYLGVIFDQKLRFAEHIRYVAEKANKATMAVCKLMPRIGGASDSKRRILAGVIDSIVLYAPQIWKEARKVKKYWGQVESLERRVALRICGAYRTTSTDALRVISRRIPLALLAEERSRPKGGEEDRRQQTLRKWQQQWDVSAKGRWTHKLIPQIEPWFNREFGSTNRFLTQFLAGHGCFRAYLTRFKICNDTKCLFCDEVDDVEHAVFHCPHFEEYRIVLPEEERQRFTPDNVIGCMLESKEKWELIARVICGIIKTKERDDRERRRLESETT